MEAKAVAPGGGVFREVEKKNLSKKTVSTLTESDFEVITASSESEGLENADEVFLDASVF